MALGAAHSKPRYLCHAELATPLCAAVFNLLPSPPPLHHRNTRTLAVHPGEKRYPPPQGALRRHHAAAQVPVRQHLGAGGAHGVPEGATSMPLSCPPTHKHAPSLNVWCPFANTHKHALHQTCGARLPTRPLTGPVMPTTHKHSPRSRAFPTLTSIPHAHAHVAPPAACSRALRAAGHCRDGRACGTVPPRQLPQQRAPVHVRARAPAGRRR
jgi:hypothetical protein